MVEIFKTNVKQASEAEQLVSHLSSLMPDCRINLDLHDSDKVLRVQGEQVIPEQVVSIAKAMGYDCMILD
jgi:hypothetical protein